MTFPASFDSFTDRVAVIGLGYVGLPLAAAIARSQPVLGFDIDAGRIAELRAWFDRTGEVSAEALAAVPNLAPSCDPADLNGKSLFVVTVPTPVDSANKPDLGPLRAACATIAPHLTPGALIVFESTVYPGVTEDICGPLLAAGSGLRPGVDFELGYSPERINPGDKLHTIDRITKIIAGQSARGVERLRALYGPVTGDRLFVAADIRTAEAAKAIENAQRDINIAFVNEIAMICGRLGLSAQDVLAAARTKWNFLDFTPGLVGGHCVAVDPYYLAQCAQDAGHEPEIILAGRRINDQMPLWIAERLDALLPRGARVLVLGLTFKENVPDLRNTRVIDLIQGLTRAGHAVVVHDPLADPAEAKAHYGVTLAPDLPQETFDCLLGAVAHQGFRSLTTEALVARLTPAGLLADLRGMWRDRLLPEQIRRWAL